jgi:orotate phosphoribosyltransferase
MSPDTDRNASDPVAGDSSVEVARLLVQTGAIAFQTSPFFTFTSGVESPVYVDNRRLLGFPGERRAVVEALLRRARELPVEAVAGTATAGIAWAAWMADALGLPMMYVRSGAKGWGRQQAVEGFAPAGAQTLLIEDLAFSGGSLLAAAEQLRTAGYEVTDCQTIVTYGIPAAARELARIGIQHHALTTIDAALGVAGSTGALSDEQTAIVRDWLARQRDERPAGVAAEPARQGSQLA